MKRLICAAALALLVAVAPVSAFNWSDLFSRVTKSVVMMYHDGGSCTAFSINEKEHYYLTAYHCLNEAGPMFLWKEGSYGLVGLAIPAKGSMELDLLIVKGEDGFPAVTFGNEPKPGAEVASLGYAFGEPQPFLITSHVVAIKDANSYGVLRRIILKDNQDIGGMSGGPVIDTNGRVIGIVAQGVVVDRHVINVAYGTSVVQIRKFIEGYVK